MSKTRIGYRIKVFLRLLTVTILGIVSYFARNDVGKVIAFAGSSTSGFINFFFPLICYFWISSRNKKIDFIGFCSIVVAVICGLLGILGVFIDF